MNLVRVGERPAFPYEQWGKSNRAGSSQKDNLCILGVFWASQCKEENESYRSGNLSPNAVVFPGMLGESLCVLLGKAYPGTTTRVPLSPIAHAQCLELNS